MIDILKTMILDFQEMPLDTGVPRHVQVDELPGKATVCFGVRRCGKSTLLQQKIGQLCQAGICRENILFLNFFDDRLHNLNGGNLELILEAYFALYPDKKGSETVYCFFDELQVIRDWEPFVDRIMRSEKCQVYITGSSAQMLSKEIATRMRGRALSYEVFPFSFREFLDAKGLGVSDKLTSKKKFLIQKIFEDYWTSGGFPEVTNLRTSLRTRVHQEYFQAILFRDLVERHDVSHPRAVVDLAHRLIDNIASLYTINRLTGYLHSLGHKAPKASVADYLGWFEDACFLFSVQIHDASLARRNANPKKIYCIDHAFVSSTASGILLNDGHLLENLVFTALRRLTSEIYYHKTGKGLEVDFLALFPDRSRRLVQVCETLAQPETRRREVAALDAAMAELHLSQGTIVTRCESEEIVGQNGTIRVVPAWKFLLDLPDD